MNKSAKTMNPPKTNKSKRLGNFGRWLHSRQRRNSDWPVKIRYRVFGDRNQGLYASSFKSLDHFNRWYRIECRHLYDITMPDGKYKKYGEGANPDDIKIHLTMDQKTMLIKNLKMQ